jgi:hypothetical protein
MAKKKNQSKKHQFKYAQTPSESGITTEATVAQPSSRPAAVATATASSQTSNRDFSYVASDLKRIAILAVCLVALEVGLAYNLVKL